MGCVRGSCPIDCTQKRIHNGHHQKCRDQMFTRVSAAHGLARSGFAPLSALESERIDNMDIIKKAEIEY